VSRYLPPPLPPARDLNELVARYERCYQCPLAYSRRTIVPGRGQAPHGIALLTDRVAGFDEYEGRLLSGPVGNLLERILAAPKVEIPTERIYLTAAVLCRAPCDRMPKPWELAACNARLRRELALARPLLIVALGAPASRALFMGSQPLPEARRWVAWTEAEREVPLFITSHPREALWGPDGEIRRKKRILYDDWQAISARFHELAHTTPDNSAEGDSP